MYRPYWRIHLRERRSGDGGCRQQHFKKSIAMKHTALIDQLSACRIVPVISIPHAERASRLADVLIEGNLPVAEITFRTTAAAAAITAMRKASTRLLVGAGTLLNVDDVKR